MENPNEQEFTPITTQEELDARISEATRPYADYDAQVARANAAEAKLLRHKVAHESGLPYELAGRLQGDTEEALKADAKTLAKLVRTRTPVAPMASTEPAGNEARRSALRSMAASLTGND